MVSLNGGCWFRASWPAVNTNPFSAAVAETATYDTQDRLQTLGSTAYQFSSPGFLQTRGGDTFQYGTRGELLQATIGGQTADVQYAGGASGLVAGVMQVNLRIPAGITPGNAVPVSVQVGNAATPGGVTIAVGN